MKPRYSNISREAEHLIERTKDKYPISDIISHHYKLNEINDAFKFSEWLREGGTDVIRSVVLPK